MDYFGPMVNLSARIGGSGHGGQIVVAKDVYDVIMLHHEELGLPVCLDMGVHQLKGISASVQLFQVLPLRVKDRQFPPLKTVTEAVRDLERLDRALQESNASLTVPVPSGLVAIVGTGIEGVDELWSANPEVMSAAVQQHNQLMRETAVAHGGYESKRDTDKFVFIFSDPLQAARWCLEVQEQLYDFGWDPALLALPGAGTFPPPPAQPYFRGLRVRMCIHLGEPVATASPSGHKEFLGPSVVVVARMLAACYGGQILLSDDVAKLVVANLSDLGDPILTDLGSHKLKGVPTEVHLHQLVQGFFKERAFNPLRTITQQIREQYLLDTAMTQARERKTLAPEGHVTFVFAKIQDSASFWDADADLMIEALKVYSAAMRRLIERHSGFEVRAESDSMFIAFQDAVRATAFAFDAQLALLSLEWPSALLELLSAQPSPSPPLAPLFRGFRVRMGVHTGDPKKTTDPVTKRVDYVGPVVNAASRIGAAGHGGQIIVSETTLAQISVEQMGERLFDLDLRDFGPVLTPLGKHRLKGVPTPLDLFEVMPEKLALRTFPSLRTVTSEMASREEVERAELASRSKRVAAPSGRMVALVFCDVEDSVFFWDEDPEATSAALSVCLAEVIALADLHGGYISHSRNGRCERETKLK